MPGMRLTLLVGAVIASAVALSLSQPPPVADADFVFLMKGMAGIKAALLVGALALIWWRLGHPYSLRTAMAYCVGFWLATGSTVLIRELSFIAAAAFLFHAGEILILITAARDYDVTRKEQRASLHQLDTRRETGPKQATDVADAA